jgi:hypothetical protein
MSAAESVTRDLIEDTLGENPAYRKLDNRLFIVKQGSTFVMINIVDLDDDRVQVRCISQLVKGVKMSQELAVDLLTMNAKLRFGAFAFEPNGNLILFVHSILGGETLDAPELLATVADVALLADEYDDKIIAKYGGQRMKDLLEEAAIERLVARADVSAFPKA